MIEISTMLPSLPTKLHHPSLPLHQVQRPHLLKHLTDGLAQGHSLTLIVAPAGFGKTTLVSQWLTALGTQTLAYPSKPNLQSPKFCWFSIDAYDNDLALFLRYLVAAIQQICPGSCMHTWHLLQAPQLPPLNDLATILLDELAALKQAFILVLEDYHLIAETAIHQLVTRLLDYLPHSIHLVVTSRMEPPLSLAQRRVRQQLTEVRAADLCFSAAEAELLFAQNVAWKLAEETIATLYAQTEGWVAGLQLAALALQSSPAAQDHVDEQAFVQAFKGNSRHVMDYLMSEVLARQPPAIQVFLMRISILDRFCAPLCAALVDMAIEDAHSALDFEAFPGVSLTSTEPTQPILEYLERANLFVVSLDDQREWYRYHHLFRDLLRHRLRTYMDTTAIAALHRQASCWLASHGLVEEALQHALAGDNPLAAAQLVEQHRHTLLNQEDWRTLDRWLTLLPAELRHLRPDLLVAQAYILVFQYKRAAAETMLQAAERLLAAEPTTAATALRGEINAFYSHLWNKPHETRRSVAAARLALEQLPVTHLYPRSGALFCLALTLHRIGQTDDAVKILQTALDEHGDRPDTLTTRLLFGLAYIHYGCGNFSLLQQIAEVILRTATQAKLALSICWAHYLLGTAHYEWHNLESAAQHFAAVVALRYSGHVLAVHDSWLGLALTYQAQGHPEQARQTVDALLQFLREMNRLTFLPTTYSFQARLALLQGDWDVAHDWVRTTDLDSAPYAFLSFEIPQFTRIKICLHQATPASLADAAQLLVEARKFADIIHSTMRLIEILALQALVLAAQGYHEQALATLEHAVTQARAGGFLRTFVDLGQPLIPLLEALRERGVATEYLDQVLAMFVSSAALQMAAPLRTTRRNQSTDPAISLTEREQEVLALLAQRYSNQEIASALAISPLTVRTHTTNLYQKLSVNSRKQAVAQAQRLGLLPAAPPNPRHNFRKIR